MIGLRKTLWILVAMVMLFSSVLTASQAEIIEMEQAPVASAETLQSTGSGDGRVDALLTRLAEGQKDGWVLAILNAGARNVSWEGNTATFRMRGFDPGLKALGAYARAADRAAWRRQALANLAAYDLQISVTFEEDGTVSKKQESKLMNQVKQAAGNAKGSIGKKDWISALADLLFCAPTTEKNVSAASLMTASSDFSAFISAQPELFPCESAAEWAPLFHVQRNWRLAVKQGPHQLVLTWDAADPATLLSMAFDKAMDSLASVPAASRSKEDSLPYLWRSSLAESAVKMKKGRLVSQQTEIDLDDLISGKAPARYAAYFAGYTPSAWLQRLTEGYHQLPDYASQPIPNTGVISQAKKGRRVTIKVPKDGRNTYVQMRDADTLVIHAEAFITPGSNVILKVPEGVYVAQYACGATWYGTENTFGPVGTYTSTNEFIVAKKKWVLTANAEQPGITISEITAADMGPKEDKSIHIKGVLAPDIRLKGNYPKNNPVIEGVSSTTGQPSTGAKFTPIIMVLDNAEEAYPHWGVTDADIIFQVPNAGLGATKLLALYADHYPSQAGPVRSGRSSMLPAALSFDAAFTFAGPPAVTGGDADIIAKMTDFGMSRTHRSYNLLTNNGYGERIKNYAGGHNLACHIADIHENLINQGVEFEERPFLFTDEKRTDGETANIIRVLHRGHDPAGPSNSASRAVFKYDAEKDAYIRNNSSGTYSDRHNGRTVYFANVIVLRSQMSYDRNYIFLKNFLVGSGSAEIFQNGRYVRGAWVREDLHGRLIFVDADGSELKLQRGKTFIVMTNDATDVTYTE